ncbi:hypothetical protein [Nocardioides dongkuii]|uniref:hypothetical protein n=1 Tax=Nocardioides dongkuii TaxID=2760089 RepID=UPI001878E6AE|nr:hypothetical protein [Nocardioides dongkuii]
MTQTQAAPAPARRTGATATAPAAPGATPAPARTEDVPRLLNRWQVAAVAACVLFGVLAALWQVLAWQASGRAADDTEQLVRIQDVRSSLFRADALAATTYLEGGLESAEQRAAYDEALGEAVRLVAEAAEAQTADTEALAQLNTALAAYAADVTQAREANRQGHQVGAEHLRTAGAALAADGTLTRPLDALVEANTQRAEDEMDGQNTLPILLTGLAALAALWWLNRQVAQRFHRYVNVGLAVAGVIVLATTLVAAAFSAVVNGRHEEVRDSSFQLAFDEADARSAANAAQAAEARRLIARSSGEGADDAWATAAATVEKEASPETLPAWRRYADVHRQVVEADDSGDWDEAVRLATGAEATEALDSFDEAATEVVDEAGAAATDDLRASRVPAIILAALTLLAGLVASGSAARGIAERRKEYA